MKSNDFLEVSMGVPYNVRNFLESGRNKYERNHMYEYDGLEWLLHKPMMFKNRITNKSCIVLQPYTYSEPLISICERVNLWADKHNVHVEVYDSRFSWYYPGMTIIIIISLPGTHIKVRKILNTEHRIDGWNKKAPVNATNIDKSK
nr:hypothetical protein [uncultured Lachnoclostridium sp.]